MLVFLEPAVAHLGKAEHPLDDPDRMFDLGPHLRFGPVPGPLDRVDDATVSIAAVGEIPRPRRFPADHGALAAIGLIAPDAGFLAMQQFGQDPAVGDIGWCRHHRMDQLGSAVDAEMRLHAEIPLVALLGLMHLRIARLGGILAH